MRHGTGAGASRRLYKIGVSRAALQCGAPPACWHAVPNSLREGPLARDEADAHDSQKQQARGSETRQSYKEQTGTMREWMMTSPETMEDFRTEAPK